MRERYPEEDDRRTESENRKSERVKKNVYRKREREIEDMGRKRGLG